MVKDNRIEIQLTRNFFNLLISLINEEYEGYDPRDTEEKEEWSKINRELYEKIVKYAQFGDDEDGYKMISIKFFPFELRSIFNTILIASANRQGFPDKNYSEEIEKLHEEHINKNNTNSLKV